MIELTSALVLLATSLFGGANVAIAQDITDSFNTQSQTVIDNPVTLQAYVEAYFKETPILAQISKCESQFRQNGKDGTVLRGIVNNADLGVMQINEKYHGETADELGFDLKTINGNLAYAQYLYDREGTKPWNASKPCWGNK